MSKYLSFVYYQGNLMFEYKRMSPHPDVIICTSFITSMDCTVFIVFNVTKTISPEKWLLLLGLPHFIHPSFHPSIHHSSHPSLHPPVSLLRVIIAHGKIMLDSDIWSDTGERAWCFAIAAAFRAGSTPARCTHHCCVLCHHPITCMLYFTSGTWMNRI